MKNIGIICEYNPFHNGHKYHLDKVKELFPESNIILVISGNVMERGELSVLTKWEKTEIALNYGVDLVVELPFIQASQAADVFCYGSVRILSLMGVDTIIFGSESNDIDSLKKCAEVQLYNREYEDLVSSFLNSGYNYPTALSGALKEITGIDISTPNDLLGLGYVKEIIKNDYSIEPITIKRTNDYHDKLLSNAITSATSIREAIKNDLDITGYVPDKVLPYLKNEIYSLDDYFPYLKYKIISEEDLTIYQTVDKDIESRIRKAINNSQVFEEFVEQIKTKYYTYNRIKRMCIHILFSLTKEEAEKGKEISYIRILGFTAKGQKYLNKIKKELEIPIITNYSNDKSGFLSIEMRVTRILALLRGKEFIDLEYKSKPIFKSY